MGTNLQQHLVDSEWVPGGRERPRLGLLINNKVSDEYVTIRAGFIRFDPDDGKPRNLTHGQPLRDVGISGQANRKRESSDTYAFDNGRIYAYALEIEPVVGIDLKQARRAVAAMSLIERRVEATRPVDEHGYAIDLGFSGWFRLVIERGCGLVDGDIAIYDGPPSGWYPDSDFRYLAIDEAVAHIEQAVKEALK